MEKVGFQSAKGKSNCTGIFSISFLWIPMRMVVIEEGHEPHAPYSCQAVHTTKKTSEKVDEAVISGFQKRSTRLRGRSPALT